MDTWLSGSGANQSGRGVRLCEAGEPARYGGDRSGLRGVGLDEFLLNVPGLRANANAIIELAKQHNLMHYFWLNGQLTMGWVMAREGEVEAGLELMRRSVTERGATEARWYQPRYLCMLAESYLWHGLAKEGLNAVAEADAVMTQTDQYIWAAEIKRVEGELRRLSGASPDEAETYFQRALTIAREQKANSFELRAATSLARTMGRSGAAGRSVRAARAGL